MSGSQALATERALLKKKYLSEHRRRGRIVPVLIPVLIILILTSAAVGSADLSPISVFTALLGKLAGHETSATTDVIIWNLRMPRILMGLIAGIALGSSGAVMQGVLRNPLADPYILGISSAAGFGASLAIVMGKGILAGSWAAVGNAFVFSILSSMLILTLAVRRNSSPQVMVLIGLSLLFFFQAMTTMLQYFGTAEAVKAAVFWTVGDLGKSDWTKLAAAGTVTAAGTTVLITRSRSLNIMNAGDEAAESLGIHTRATRHVVMITTSIMVATVVSFTGTIGFIGLVAPHLVRLISGSDNTVLIPGSALTGAVLLIAADTVARTVLSPVILPVGAVTAFMGVPLFVYLIMRKGGILS